jgi:hypothetical protein
VAPGKPVAPVAPCGPFEFIEISRIAAWLVPLASLLSRVSDEVPEPRIKPKLEEPRFAWTAAVTSNDRNWFVADTGVFE